METKFNAPKIPVDYSEGSSKVEVHDVTYAEQGRNEYMGAVVVGCRYTADCFPEYADADD